MKGKRILFILVLIAVLMGGAYRPALAAETQATTCKTYHTVARGEYLSQIAKKYGVSWRWLAEINELTNPSKIFPGQKLCVEVQEAPAVCTAYHTVARGEYLSQIAKKYGVTWRWLAEINNLADPNKIVTGQKLCVEVDVEAACTTYHTVAKGEYLVEIARKYNVTWRWLAEINELANPSRIYPGQKLCVAMSGAPVTPPTGGVIPTISITGVVKDGSVTIQTKDFPANTRFVVLMDVFGTRAVNGIQVGTLDSGQGGSLQGVFQIPADLKGESRIAIRLESPTTGYYAYNWFYNTTQP